MKNYSGKLKQVITISVGGIAYLILFYHLFIKEHILTSNLISSANFSFLNVSLIIVVWFVYIISQGWYLKKVLNYWHIPIDILKSTKTWLATVALGVVTFGIGGIALIFYQSKMLTQSKENKLPSKITLSYYAGYIIAALILLVLTLALIFSNFYLRWLLILVLAVFVGLKIFWPKLNWIKPLHALPAVILNLVLFVFSFKLLGLHLASLDYLKSYNVNLLLSIISPSSGGLGFVELGLLKYLEFSGLNAVQASLATAAYRLISLWLTAILGYFAMLSLGVSSKISKN